MFKFKRVLLASVSSVAFLFSPAANSGGVVAGATEFTQILNNFELMAQVQQQVATVSQLAQSYVVQYNQLREQLLAGTKIAGLSIADVMKMKNDMEAYQSSLGGLGRDLQSLEGMFDARLVEAKLRNMTFEDYVVNESSRIDNNNKAAKARIARERAMVNQVQDDIVQVREYGRRVDSTVGVHESTQLLNGQMNLMLQQMTRLVTLTAEAQGSDRAEEMNNEAVTRERLIQNAKQTRQINESLKQRDDQSLDRMSRYRHVPR